MVYISRGGVMQEKANLTLSYTNGEAGNGTVFVQCCFSSRFLFCLLLFFPASGLFYLLLDENKWNITLNWWIKACAFFTDPTVWLFFLDCNAQVHKGCRESLPVCAKVKMKVFQDCLLSWFSYDICHKQWNFCFFANYCQFHDQNCRKNTIWIYAD